MFPRSKILEREIRRRIGESGRITFREFMEITLYHPQAGYYTNDDRRPWVDYVTSPETHRAFGVLVAKQLEEMWRILGRPKLFNVVEMGAGLGFLCHDILNHTAHRIPEFFEALRYRIVEGNPNLVEDQKHSLEQGEGLVDKVSWVGALRDLGGFEGCLLSNELLDSFPVHRVVRGEGGLEEIYITLDGVRLVEVRGVPSTPLLQEHLERFGVRLGLGVGIEINLAALRWMEEGAKLLKEGFVLTFDYGYETGPRRAERKPRGTLRCYHNHSINPYPLLRIGYQDITADIDFTSLVKAGEAQGLRTLGLTTQRRFLINLGLDQLLDEMESLSPSPQEFNSQLAAMRALVDPHGLGRIKTLIQYRGGGEPRLTGLEGGKVGGRVWRFGDPRWYLERRLTYRRRLRGISPSRPSSSKPSRSL